MKKEKWTLDFIPDLGGKVIIVTGGNTGLGYESVKALAAKGAEVILTSRSHEKGESAKARIIDKVPEAKIVVMQLDLTDLSSIKKFSEEFKNKYDRLDVLMNNAGIMMSPYFLTKDGFEGQMGTNHLGHFALTGLLLDHLIRTPGSRVVNVSSGAHKSGVMDFDNLLFKDGKGYSPIKAYGRSKLANLLFTYELHRKFEENGIDSIALASHPGGSRTDLGRYMLKKFFVRLLWPIFLLISQSAAKGALTQIRAAVDPGASGGDYYGPFNGIGEMTGYPRKVESNEASHNMDDARRLWQESEKLTGIVYRF
jgi:NAD(P)-dependent dehydrogenase (short-subunit alcohol dehydrogenase family)